MITCKNPTRNYARCSKIMQHSCMLFDMYTILKEIMQDSCTIAMQEFNKKLCKMFKNHATLLHAIWYVHKILKEIMQDVQKSCNLLACYLIRTQDSQRNYARGSKIMQLSCMLLDTYTRFSRKVCKKCSKTVQEKYYARKLMFKNHATFCTIFDKN